jgi:ketosteroid isomerase-like protein
MGRTYSTRATDESAIRAADAQWSKTAASKDLDAAVSYYSDEATVLPPNAPMAKDKQTIRAVWAPLVAPGVDTSWQLTKVEVSRSGELGYVVGVYQVKAKDAQGNSSTESGKLVEVWKKQPDGKWKCVADIFNSDMPLPSPPQQEK